MRQGKRRVIVICIAIHFLVLINGFGQDTFIISGKVLGAGKSAVNGVSVSIENTDMTPVITNQEGYFEIKSPVSDGYLIFNPVEDYKPKRVYLNQRKEITIYLVEKDMASGNDLIPVPYGNQERANIVSAHASYDTRKNHYKNNNTIDEYFQGTVPGMWVTGQSGMPGTGTVSYLRGMKSLFTNNQPLYVIDGVPMETPGIFQSQVMGYPCNPLTSLNPLDAASITIMKDYLATATYGLRGSNGVILIETLKATEVKTTIDLIVRTGMVTAPDFFPQLNRTQYKTLANELLISSGKAEENFTELYPSLYTLPGDDDNYRYMHNTVWQDQVYQNATFRDIYLKVKGGDEIARYGLSLGYNNQESIIQNSGFDRFNIRFVGTFNIFKWLRFHISSDFNYNFSDLKESALQKQTSPILTSLFKSPLLNPYEFDEEGNQLTSLDDVEYLGISNPLATVLNYDAQQKNYRSLSTFRLEGDISDRCKLNNIFGLNFNSLDENVFMPNYGTELYYGGEAYNVAKSASNYLYSVYSDNYISYQALSGKLHQLTLTGGFRINTNKYELDYGISKNSHENDEYKSISNGTFNLKEIGGENVAWNRLGVYLNANYSFRNKYLLNLSSTAETSTRIGQNAPDVFMLGQVPFGVFYSAGGAWRISSEEWFENWSWLEDFKLRLSYGSAGNDDIGNYQSYNYMIVDHYRETTAIIPGNISLNDLTFERYQQWNPGLDISIRANKIHFSLDYYNILTQNMLIYEPQSAYIGFETLPTNEGELLNRGWEGSFSSRVCNTKRFRWDLGVNLNWMKSELMEIRSGSLINEFPGGEYISSVGNPLLSFWGFVYNGVFKDSETALEANLVNKKGLPFRAGDAIFEDLSGPDGTADGIINDYDKTIIGSPIPDFYGGLYSSMAYLRWSLNIQLQFVHGNDVFNYLRSQNEKMSDLSNQGTYVLNRWHYEGQETDVPQAAWDDPVGNSAFSTRWIEDGSYLRIKDITLAYTIPDKFLAFNNASFYFTVSNLLTFTHYYGYDPEFSYSFETIQQGIDYGLAPHTRKFMIGIKVGL